MARLPAMTTREILSNGALHSGMAAIFLGVFGAVNATSAAETAVTVVGRPAAGKFDHYVANRAPLAPSPLVRLPIGAVRPEGWLKKQLELQAEGFHGRLTEISRFLKKENSRPPNSSSTWRRLWSASAA
mgnify:CR=1 FL=1